MFEQKQSRITLSFAILVLTTLLAACATATQDPLPTDSSVLRDTEWELVALGGDALIENTEITLHFEEASIDGSAGCNTYGGDYTVSEDGLRLNGVYATEMACMTPEGVMAQEQAYLDALHGAARFQMDGDRLAVYDEAGTETLTFVAAAGSSSAQATHTTEAPAETPPAPEPPAGSKHYLHTDSGVSLWVPESWTIVEPSPRGGTIILQSYPKDKYVGGEARQPGDSKCDLTVHPPDLSVAELMTQIKSDPSITVVSEQEMVLKSGRTGTRLEVDSMGRSVSLISEVNGRAVVLTCFGELGVFDGIAVTLGGDE